MGVIPGYGCVQFYREQRGIDGAFCLADFIPVAGKADDLVHLWKLGRLEKTAADLAVSRVAPRVLRTTGRSIGRSSHNVALRADLARLPAEATDIRVNQHRVNAAGKRVGINRPDLQYTLNGKRYCVEYEGRGMPRGESHTTRILANDPRAHSVAVKEIP